MEATGKVKKRLARVASYVGRNRKDILLGREPWSHAPLPRAKKVKKGEGGISPLVGARAASILKTLLALVLALLLTAGCSPQTGIGRRSAPLRLPGELRAYNGRYLVATSDETVTVLSLATSDLFSVQLRGEPDASLQGDKAYIVQGIVETAEGVETRRPTQMILSELDLKTRRLRQLRLPVSLDVADQFAFSSQRLAILRGPDVRPFALFFDLSRKTALRRINPPARLGHLVGWVSDSEVVVTGQRMRRTIVPYPQDIAVWNLDKNSLRWLTRFHSSILRSGGVANGYAYVNYMEEENPDNKAHYAICVVNILTGRIWLLKMPSDYYSPLYVDNANVVYYTPWDSGRLLRRRLSRR